MKEEESCATIEVGADTCEELDKILDKAKELGGPPSSTANPFSLPSSSRTVFVLMSSILAQILRLTSISMGTGFLWTI